MKDFDALKNIWHGQAELPVIDYDDLLRRVRSSRSVFSNTLLLQSGVLFVAIAAMIALLLRAPFQYGTSQAGVSIFILCCLVYLVIQVKDYLNMRSSESLLSAPDEYIAYLKSYKRARYVLNTRIYRIYMLFMGTGLALFFIEFFFSVSLVKTVLAVTFTIAWFLVSYLVFMKRYIRKEENRLNEMIRNLERLRQQFREAAAD